MHHMNRFGSDRGDFGGGNGGAKRPFEKVNGDDSQGALLGDKRQKLPALASVVVEAVKMDSLQKLCSSLEPILRKVVGEEVERALARLLPNRLGARTPPRQIQESPMSDLHLDFTNRLCLPLFTNGKVEGEIGSTVHIVLKDATTGQVVSSGPASSAKLEVVVLDGDFANEDDEWTAEDFENAIVKARDGKRPLLTGDLIVTLKEGVGTLGELTFTDNSSWIRSRKFRLGVRVAPGFCEGIRIKECKTEAFTVKDHRGELYKKHYPPRLHDEVWRLDKIGKDGAFHKRLQQSNIKTVQDFLRFYIMDQQKLRNTLGGGMSNKMWEATVDHAKTCVLPEKLYVYYADSSRNVGVIFNNIYELLGVTSNNTYKSVEFLTDQEKVYVDKLVKNAYENWSSLTEYENGTLVNETANKHALAHVENESSSVSQEQPVMYSQALDLPQQQSGQFQSMSTPTSILASSTAPELYGYGQEPSSRYVTPENQIVQSNQAFNTESDPHGQSSSSITFQGSFPTSGGPANTGRALGPSQTLISRSFGGYSAPVSQQAFQGASVEWQHYVPMSPDEFTYNEEEIRAQARALLGHEDLLHLLRPSQYSFNPENVPLQGENAYFSGFTPPPAVSYVDDGGRSSGKAYVGWLKLKAALRWGIFIRKIAEKKKIQRAQLEEIED